MTIDATSPPVPTMGRKANAWPRTAQVVPVEYRPIAEALTTVWPDDRHAAAYSAPQVPVRLSSEAVAEIPGGVAVTTLWVDWDAPGHAATPEWLGAVGWPAVRAALGRWPGGFAYATRGGLRIVWRLARPRLIADYSGAIAWRREYLGWVALLRRECGIDGDRSCQDWTRLYRLPRVVRDGAAQDPPGVGDPTLASGAWDAEALPVDDALLIGDGVAAPAGVIPPGVPGEDQQAAAVRLLAARWPREGRHRACLALGGALVGDGWPPEIAAEFVVAVMGVAGGWAPGAPAWGQERAKQAKQAADGARLVAAGAALAGWGSLAEIVGGEAADATRDALWVEAPEVAAARARFAELGRRVGAPAAGPPGTFRAELARAWDEVRRALEAAVAADGAEPAPLFVPAGDVLDAPRVLAPWVVRGVVKRGGVAVVGAGPKVGKTWFWAEVACAIAAADRAFGEFEAGVLEPGAPPRPGRVCYLFAEDQIGDVQAKFRALCRGREGRERAVRERVRIQPAGRFLDLTRVEDLALIVASARWGGAPPDVLVLEPLRDLHSGEEDSSDSMRDVMRALRVIGTLLGCTVVTAHHTRKTEPGKRGRAGDALRGSSAIFGALDCLVDLASVGGNGEDEFLNEAESVVRGGRSAGSFRLGLKITDDEHGSAVDARWTYSKESKADREAREGAEASAADRGAEDEVVARVRALRAAGQHVTVDAVRKLRIGMGNAAVSAALKRLGDLPAGDPRRVVRRRAWNGAQQLDWSLVVEADEPGGMTAPPGAFGGS